MNKSELRKLIREQIKTLKSKDKLSNAFVPSSMPQFDLDPGAGGHEAPLHKKHQIAPDTSNVPDYAGSASVPYYVCGLLPGPDGTGHACYECVNGVLTSPLTGNMFNCPCYQWQYGGSCYGFKHNADIPTNYIPYERSCMGPHNWQTHPNGPGYGGCLHS